jgi:hypothetical protein
MNATIQTTGETISGKTLKEIKTKMCGMLKVEGPRGLTAITEDGAEIHVELYEGQDYIKAADGRIIFRNK